MRALRRAARAKARGSSDAHSDGGNDSESSDSDGYEAGFAPSLGRRSDELAFAFAACPKLARVFPPAPFARLACTLVEIPRRRPGYDLDAERAKASAAATSPALERCEADMRACAAQMAGLREGGRAALPVYAACESRYLELNRHADAARAAAQAVAVAAAEAAAIYQQCRVTLHIAACSYFTRDDYRAQVRHGTKAGRAAAAAAAERAREAAALAAAAKKKKAKQKKKAGGSPSPGRKPPPKGKKASPRRGQQTADAGEQSLHLLEGAAALDSSAAAAKVGEKKKTSLLPQW